MSHIWEIVKQKRRRWEQLIADIIFVYKKVSRSSQNVTHLGNQETRKQKRRWWEQLIADIQYWQFLNDKPLYIDITLPTICVFIDGGVSNRIYDKTELWPIPYRAIYFDIAPDLHFNKEMKGTVVRAIEYMNKHACVRWLQKMPWDTGVKDYVVFNTKINDQCGAHRGYKRGDGKHFINLTEICYQELKEHDENSINTAPLHEMMHILGFYHEHQRPDRDCYITVPLPVIEKDNETRNTWWPYESTDYVYGQFPYDYKSVLHYRRFDVHANNPSIGELGVLNGTMTDHDLWKIETIYCKRPSYCQQNSKHCEQIKNDKLKNPNCTRIDYVKLERELKDRQKGEQEEEELEYDEKDFEEK